jgi:lysozyme
MNWTDIVYDFLRRPDIEGERLTAYPDPGTGGEPWTIGVGHTGMVEGKKVAKGMKITPVQSKQLLLGDIAVAAGDVDRLVKLPLTQHQKAALVSFVFNIGGTQFATSSMLRLINSNQFSQAADQFPRWNKAAGKVLNGLINRRAYEKQMFLTPD